jgi:hypothetical protein
MKIALCLSGQPRFFEQGFSSIYPNLMKGYDVDVFVHTWYSPSDCSKPFRIGKDGTRWFIKEGADEWIRTNYQPKSSIFESSKKFSNPSINLDNTSIKYSWPKKTDTFKEYFQDMSYSMCYSIYKSNELRLLYQYQNALEYDYVVRTRFDLGLTHKIKYEDLDPQAVHYYLDRPLDMINDWLIISNSSNMNVLCSAFNFYDKYYEETGLFANEPLLTSMLVRNGISYIGHNWGLTLPSIET